MALQTKNSTNSDQQLPKVSDGEKEQSERESNGDPQTISNAKVVEASPKPKTNPLLKMFEKMRERNVCLENCLAI